MAASKEKKGKKKSRSVKEFSSRKNEEKNA